jgi:hypothetical protein
LLYVKHEKFARLTTMARHVLAHLFWGVASCGILANPVWVREGLAENWTGLCLFAKTVDSKHCATFGTCSSGDEIQR